MDYIKTEFEDSIFWIEVDEEKYAKRQIVSDANGGVEISCFDDCLAEGSINLSEIEGITQLISKGQFEEIWAKYTRKCRNDWDIVKQKYSKGDRIKGRVKYHYPCGSVIQIGSWQGIYLGEQNLEVNEQYNGVITGYDEVNMWIVVEVETRSDDCEEEE